MKRLGPAIAITVAIGTSAGLWLGFSVWSSPAGPVEQGVGAPVEEAESALAASLPSPSVSEGQREEPTPADPGDSLDLVPETESLEVISREIDRLIDSALRTRHMLMTRGAGGKADDRSEPPAEGPGGGQ